MNFSDTLFSERQCHGNARSIELYGALGSRKIEIKGLQEMCPRSEFCRKVEIWFIQPRTCRKPVWFSETPFGTSLDEAVILVNTRDYNPTVRGVLLYLTIARRDLSALKMIETFQYSLEVSKKK